MKEDTRAATRKLEVIAYYPFGGSTKGKPAVTRQGAVRRHGRTVGPDILKKYTEAELADAIVVVDMPLARR